MKICVISDSHGNTNDLEKVLSNTTYNHIFFLGDGERDFEYFLNDDRVTMIEGNCDLYSPYPLLETKEINGVKIMLCHGHLYNVRQGIYSLLKKGINLGAKIICYGHTHIQSIQNESGIWVVNPGALNMGKALEIEINERKEIKFNPIQF
ncbi:MAG: YfcE family phosphodiesterase [Clostridia bacterium]|nr:YfcE family phosphodiesterase [Clostridia bacterium]